MEYSGAERSRVEWSGVEFSGSDEQVKERQRERKSFCSMLFLSNQMANKYGGIDDDLVFFLCLLSVFLSFIACFSHQSLFMQKYV